MDDLSGSTYLFQHVLQCRADWPSAPSMSCGTMEDAEEPELLRYLKQGTRQQREQAFTVFYKRYYLDVWKFICSKVTAEEDAKDVFAVVWQIGFERLPNFDWQEKPIKSWLFTTAEHKIQEHFRQQKRQPMSLDADGFEQKIWDTIEATLELRPPTAAEETSPQIVQEADNRVQRLLSQLKDRERQVIIYKYFHNRTNIEIAKILNETPSNIGAILSRTMQKLKKMQGA